VGGKSAWLESAIGLIGPGTGLGVSGLLPDGHGGWMPLQGEGGHVTLAGVTPRENAVLEQIGIRYGHVSVETRRVRSRARGHSSRHRRHRCAWRAAAAPWKPPQSPPRRSKAATRPAWMR